MQDGHLKRRYDGTIVRAAGNLLSGYPRLFDLDLDGQRAVMCAAVRLAREMVAETIRTEAISGDEPPE